MAKTNDYRKSAPSESDANYAPGEFSGAADPPIDLERGQEAGDALEKVNPKFKAMMDMLRAAAKKVGRAVCLCFVAALAAYGSKH